MAFWQKKPKHRPPDGPFEPEPMAGAGALGDQLADPRKYRFEPGHRETVETAATEAVVQSAATPPKPLPQPSLNLLEVMKQYGLSAMRTFPQTIAAGISITPRLVGSTAVRLDIGIKDRISILIANMSDVVIWLNTHGKFVAGQGYPLAPNTESDAYNGGSLCVDCQEGVEWWGLAASGTSNLVLIVEASR